MDKFQQKLRDFEYENKKRLSAFMRVNSEINEKHPQLWKIKNEIDKTWVSQLRGEIDLKTAQTRADRLMGEYENYLIKNDISRKLCEYEPKCQLCGDSGYVDGKMCVCLRNFIFGEESKSSFEENFSKFNPKVYSTDENLRLANKVLGLCRGYAEGFGEKNEWLLLMGRPGTGKSFFAKCIASEVSQRGYTVKFTTAYNLIEKFTPGDDLLEDDKAFRDSVFNCDLLIIDDLGTERDTNFSMKVLFNIINERYNNKKAVVFTTNCTVNELSDTYGARLVSRIVGSTTGQRMPDDDIRMRLKLGVVK